MPTTKFKITDAMIVEMNFHQTGYQENGKTLLHKDFKDASEFAQSIFGGCKPLFARFRKTLEEKVPQKISNIKEPLFLLEYEDGIFKFSISQKWAAKALELPQESNFSSDEFWKFYGETIHKCLPKPELNYNPGDDPLSLYLDFCKRWCQALINGKVA